MLGPPLTSARTEQQATDYSGYPTSCPSDAKDLSLDETVQGLDLFKTETGKGVKNSQFQFFFGQNTGQKPNSLQSRAPIHPLIGTYKFLCLK